MENTKMTNSMALANAIATLQGIEGYDSEVIAKLENIKTSIDKKNTSRKPSAKTLANRSENERLATVLLDILADNELKSMEDIKANTEFAELSSSKIASIMKIARENGANIQKSVVKKVNFYKLIEG